MAIMQKTFGELVGMNESVKVTDHPSDLLLCEDGISRIIGEVFTDCRGLHHGEEDDRHDANVEIVECILEGIGEWVDDYTTGNSDYPDMYFECFETHHWPERIRDWLEENDFPWIDDKKISGEIIDLMCEDMRFHGEPEYTSSDYACYSGSGCEIDSFDIGEYENQIDINEIDELRELHEQGILDDVLDSVNCDVYVSRHQSRVKNEKTGHYENVGRETYGGPDEPHPCLMTYHTPGGRWHFIVSAENMREVITASIVKLLEGRK